MKKKLASLIVMVAVLVSMLSTTVFADTESSKKQLETIKTQMEQTADYLADNYAVKIQNNGYDCFKILQILGNDLFFINKSGIQSENLSFLNNEYHNAVKTILTDYGKLIPRADKPENMNTYAFAIITLLSMGDDPTNFIVDGTSYDIVGMLNNYLKSNPLSESEEFNFECAKIFKSVFLYYKDNYDAIANELNNYNELILSYYVKNGYEAQIPVLAEQVTSLGIDKVLDSDEYELDGYVRLNGGNDEANNAIVAKLNNSKLPNAGEFSQIEGMLCLKKTIKGAFLARETSSPYLDNMFIWPLSDSLGDNKAYATSVKDNPQTSVTVKEASESVLATIHNSINEQGIFIDPSLAELDRVSLAQYTTHALGATSDFNRLGDADLLYAGLNLFRLNDGSYKGALDDPEGNLGSTAYALGGIVVYYFEKSGIGSVFDLSITDTTVNPDTPLEMKEVVTHDWVVGSDFGFTVSSPANFASFWDVAVDGSSAIAGLAQVGADGVSTYATVGGGSLRVETGSTIVTLSPEYLATLAPGEHTIRIQSANGYAETTLNIVATPQTGDSEGLGLFITLTACGLGMAAVAVARKVKAER